MEVKQAAFEGWAIVEMMGHQREIGFVTTETYGQAVLFRVDQPEMVEREYTLRTPTYCYVDGGQEWCPKGTKVRREGSPPRSRLIAPGSLYALNPCTEEAAREAMEQSIARPLIALERPKKTPRLLIDAYEPRPDDEEELNDPPLPTPS